MVCLRLQRPAIKACFSVHVGASLILVKYVFPLVIRQVYLGDYNCGKSLATEEESQHSFCQCFLCTPLVKMNLRSPCCTTQRMNYLLIQLSWYYCSSDVTLFNSVEQH